MWVSRQVSYRSSQIVKANKQTNEKNGNKQNKTRQNKTKQNKTKQNKTKQKKTKDILKIFSFPKQRNGRRGWGGIIRDSPRHRMDLTTISYIIFRPPGIKWIDGFMYNFFKVLVEYIYIRMYIRTYVRSRIY